ncbi:hypothetical protein BH10BAC2_BH10BAC2_49980 [soil metagenome]
MVAAPAKDHLMISVLLYKNELPYRFAGVADFLMKIKEQYFLLPGDNIYSDWPGLYIKFLC